MRKILLLIGLVLLLLFSALGKVSAKGDISCQDRYLTLVNPVRGRERWKDKTTKPLKDQYTAISEKGFSATWLVQYDSTVDNEVVEVLVGFDKDQELGVFLEVSPEFAKAADVIYPHATPWDDPNAVFLSGYGRKERKRLIDTLFEAFKESFGYYPSSVGAWWIDSYSLNYLKEEYGIKAAMIVADQLTTDDYGVWGQWWGVPYYPTTSNVLVPADGPKNKLDVVVTQWAQRDLTKAYGQGPAISNFSLQANDYIKQGLDTGYFLSLVKTYQDCANPIGQVTVGLETGMESVDYFDEYLNQLDALFSLDAVAPVTLSEFSDKYREVFPNYPKKIVLADGVSKWVLTPVGRTNEYLGDRIDYKQGISFSDYFVKDDDGFLDRRLPLENKKATSSDLLQLLVLGLLLSGLYKLLEKRTFFVGILVLFASYGLALRAKEQFGWQVFYSFTQQSLLLTKVLLVFAAFLIVLLFQRVVKKDWMVWFLPLSFGLTPIFKILRFSKLSGEYIFGIATSNHHFAGLGYRLPFGIRFISQDYPPAQAAALLRMNHQKLLADPFKAIFLFPLVQIAFSLILIFIFKKLPKKAKLIMVVAMVILTILYLYQTFTAEPVAVVPIK